MGGIKIFILLSGLITNAGIDAKAIVHHIGLNSNMTLINHKLCSYLMCTDPWGIMELFEKARFQTHWAVCIGSSMV